MQGWEHKPLGSTCSIARGGSPRPIQEFLTDAADGVNWIKISDATASGRYIYRTAEKIKPAGVMRSRLVKDGDFLLSNSMSFGRPYIMRTSGCIHDGWLVLSDYQKTFDQTFLYYVLGSPQVFSQFDRLAAGSTVRNLNIDLASRVFVPVPPLPEQRRIVAILDEAFEAIATAKANTEKNVQNVRALLDLTRRDMFASLADEHEPTTLGRCCTFENGDRGKNYPGKEHRVAHGVPFINAGHLTEDGLDFSQMDYISEERFELLGNGKIRPRDVLFCLRGSLGKFACVDDLGRGAIASSLVILRPVAGLTTDYLLEFLASTQCADQIEQHKGGAAQPNLGAQDLKRFELPLPPIDMQEATATRLASLRAAVSDARALLSTKLAAFDELKKSLLHQAFTGQLTAKTTDKQLAEVA